MKTKANCCRVKFRKALVSLEKSMPSTQLKDVIRRIVQEMNVSIREDVNARKDVEQALRESEKRYRQLFQSNPQPTGV